ncbi:BLUF domain-containing protein [Hymenobacter fodinae]|uniref:BLUF domain-containing protein n=1 Tax=Hymenobacter fodinae TaxID=2510796 RepID=A0A4Z0NZY0_9BACT|nr:BLUF domain-containing protein [Hymenobacter fodinae]TGE03758.1 BLUF domain-containing protein [Hymenobacter fodinae]
MHASLLERLDADDLSVPQVSAHKESPSQAQPGVHPTAVLPDDTYYLLYRSHAARGTHLQQVLALLEHAQVHNLQAGITGLLCYCDGLFVQLLEGSTAAVQELYAKIECDPRHQGVTILRTGLAAHRCFAQRSMAFTEASPLEYYWLIHQFHTHPSPPATPQQLIRNPWLLALLTAFL